MNKTQKGELSDRVPTKGRRRVRKTKPLPFSLTLLVFISFILLVLVITFGPELIKLILNRH